MGMWGVWGVGVPGRPISTRLIREARVGFAARLPGLVRIAPRLWLCRAGAGRLLGKAPIVASTSAGGAVGPAGGVCRRRGGCVALGSARFGGGAAVWRAVCGRMVEAVVRVVLVVLAALQIVLQSVVGVLQILKALFGSGVAGVFVGVSISC